MNSGRLLVPLLAVVSPVWGGTIAASFFDSSAESWHALTADSLTSGFPVKGPASLAFDPVNGNPAGSVSAADPDGFDTMFSAPAAFLGNIASANGGTLRFDLRGDRAGDYDGVELVIAGGGRVLVYDLPFLLNTNWRTVAVPLGPSANWTRDIRGGAAATIADFQAALASVTAIYIGGEFVNGIVETAFLDNVVLESPDSGAVPEPPTVLFLGTGVAMLLIGRRARLRR